MISLLHTLFELLSLLHVYNNQQLRNYLGPNQVLRALNYAFETYTGRVGVSSHVMFTGNEWCIQGEMGHFLTR